MTDPRSTDPRIEPAVKAWYAHNPQVHPNERMARALAAADAVDPRRAREAAIRQLTDDPIENVANGDIRFGYVTAMRVIRQILDRESAVLGDEAGTDKAEPPDDLRAVERRLRAILAAVPYFGDWDEWTAIAYDKIPVLPRAVMAHIYGRHDDTPLPYSPCPLCELFRTGSVGAQDQGSTE